MKEVDIRRRDRFCQSLAHIRGLYPEMKQQDIAAKMGATPANISSAKTGNVKVLTNNFLLRFNEAFGRIFSERWLLDGEGEMLRPTNNVTINHSPNAIANAGDHVSIVGHTTTNSYGDSPDMERNWCPVVPRNVATMPETDTIEYLRASNAREHFERLYSGRAPVDMWMQMNDRSLEPYIMQGDYIGLKAYPKGVYDIFQGDIYAIDTRFDGIKVRVIKNGKNETTLMACSYNKQDYPDQEIPKSDIIRVYKKVLMFRY